MGNLIFLEAGPHGIDHVQSRMLPNELTEINQTFNPMCIDGHKCIAMLDVQALREMAKFELFYYTEVEI